MKSNGDQPFQAAAQIGEQGGELAVGRNRFGDLQQRFITRAGGVRMNRDRALHR